MNHFGMCQDFAAKMVDELRETRFVVQFAIVVLGGEQPQIAGDGEDRHLADVAQVRAVDALDVAPLRVEVRLRQHRRHVRRHAHGVAQELHLGLGVLLRRIRHEQHGMRRRQRRKRGQRVGGVEPADARRVDQPQPAAQQFAGQNDLGRQQLLLVAGVAALGDVVGERFERDVDLLDDARLVALLLHDPCPGRLGETHRGGDARGHIVVHGAHRGVDEGVDELALALLELPDHDDPHVRVLQPLAGVVQPLGQIGTTGGGRERLDIVDERDQLPSGLRRHHRRLVGGLIVSLGDVVAHAFPLENCPRAHAIPIRRTGIGRIGAVTHLARPPREATGRSSCQTMIRCRCRR